MGPDVHGREVGAAASGSPGRGWRERVDLVLAAVIFALFARTFLFQAFEVPSPSMEKNVLTGDRLLVNKFVFAERGAFTRLLPARPVRRGDVLVFRFPDDPRRDFIKRVVGLPGETVAIRDKQISIDGTPLDEPYAFHADDTVWPGDPSIPEPHRRRDQMPPLRVPEGSYFVMGDNRDDSSDSRSWGPVQAGAVKGRALFVYWSFRPRPSDAREGVAAVVRWPLDVIHRTRWDRFFHAVR